MRRGFLAKRITIPAPVRISASILAIVITLSMAGCNRSSSTAEGEGANALAADGTADAQPGGNATASGAGRAASAGRVQTPPPPRVYTLDAGTPIRVRTTSTISTKSYASGQTFAATLAEPLVVEDKVIAPRGAGVLGRVVNSDPGGRVKGVASITLTLVKLETGDGQEIAIDTNNVGRQARTTKKKDATKIGIGAGVGAAIGALAGGGKGAAIGAASGGGAGTGVVLATRGEPAVVPAESLLTFRTQAPVDLRF